VPFSRGNRSDRCVSAHGRGSSTGISHPNASHARSNQEFHRRSQNIPQNVSDSFLERANTLGATRMATLMGKTGPVILSETEAIWLNAYLRVIAYRRGEA